MRIPGPYSDDTWDWLSRSQNEADAPPEPRPSNAVSRVIWELGLVLFVPLVGAGIIELTLKALNVY